jgi:membrane protease YdiL (CAAX protease family)
MNRRQILHTRGVLVAILIAMLLGFGLPMIAARLASAATSHWWRSAKPESHLLAWLFVQHGAQAALALIAIAIYSAWRSTGADRDRDSERLIVADFGLRLPRRLDEVATAALWALAICALFTLVAYLPNILGHSPPPRSHPLTPASIAGWSIFEGVYVGPTEEILFRSLLIGYLSAAMPGVIRMGRFAVTWAALLSALLFALGHYQPVWWQALFQMIYAFVLGIFYAYWFERTHSVIVPALAHNVTDLAATLTGFAVSALWR